MRRNPTLRPHLFGGQREFLAPLPSGPPLPPGPGPPPRLSGAPPGPGFASSSELRCMALHASLSAASAAAHCRFFSSVLRRCVPELAGSAEPQAAEAAEVRTWDFDPRGCQMGHQNVDRFLFLRTRREKGAQKKRLGLGSAGPLAVGFRATCHGTKKIPFKVVK